MSHFTLQDRITIQSELSHRSPFHSIALLLSKSPSTISREIRNHLLVRDRSSYPQVRMMNDCVHRFECRLRCVCQPHCRFQNGNCRFCGHCFRFCQRYEKEICPSLSHPPLMSVMVVLIPIAAHWNKKIIRRMSLIKNIAIPWLNLVPVSICPNLNSLSLIGN